LTDDAEDADDKADFVADAPGQSTDAPPASPASPSRPASPQCAPSARTTTRSPSACRRTTTGRRDLPRRLLGHPLARRRQDLEPAALHRPAPRGAYVIHPVSNLPLLDGDVPAACDHNVPADRLTIEVSIRELDESSISFPPIDLRAKRVQDGLMLTIPFADLERDSDGDGLTDSPRSASSPTPPTPTATATACATATTRSPGPWVRRHDDPSAALAAVLERVAGMKPGAIITRSGPREAPTAAAP